MADETPPTDGLPPPDDTAQPDDTGQPDNTTEPDGTAVDSAPSRAKRIGLIVGSVGLVGGLLFAGFTLFFSDEGPIDRAEDFFAALEAEDVLGARESLLPGERRFVLDPLLAEVEEARRLGILSDVNLNALQGLDLQFKNVTYEVEALADDLAWVAISGDVTAGFRPEDLPLGPLVNRYLPDSWADDLPSNIEEDTALDESFGLALVKQGGNWYVSLFHTIAEGARREAGAAFPDTQPFDEPAGAATPAEAMEQVVLAVANLDLRALVSVLDPDETAAFRRYADLFLEDWDTGVAGFRSQMDASGFSYSVDEVVGGSAQRGEDTVAWIEDIPKFGVAIDVPDLGGRISIERDGECWKIQVPDSLLELPQEAFPVPGIDFSQFTGEDCLSPDAFGEGLTGDPLEANPFAGAEDLVFELPIAGPLLDRWSESFDNLDEAGASAVQFHLEEHDGRWYVSLAGTLHRWVMAFTGTLDEALLTKVGDDIRQAAEDPDAIEQRFREFLIELEARGLLDPFTAGLLGQQFPPLDLDALAEQCQGGDDVSCDVLFLLSPIGSPGAQIGFDCGGRRTSDAVSCSGYDPATSTDNSYGDDLLLDALYDLCTEGIIGACDALFNISPVGSEYEAFGDAGGTTAITDLIPGGVEFFEITDRSHTEGPVDYPQDPPAGGPHHPIWLNCGYYVEPVPNEHAVHSLEHGVVWITFQPGLPAEDMQEIRRLADLPEVIASPYPGLDSPVVATSWGAQMRFASAFSPDLEQFAIALHDRTAPEPSAGCRGGVGDPD